MDFILLARGRCDEAIAAGRRAVEVAPLYGYASFNLGATYCHARQFDKAIEELCRTVDLEPGSPLYHGVLAHCYAAAGQQNSAIRECEKALALTGDAPFLRLHSAVAYAILHEVAGAHKLLEEAEQNWKPNGISAFWIACVHACLGEKDAAFAWLERAFQERCSFLVWVKIFYPLARLHGDPRFDALVKRIGIPT